MIERRHLRLVVSNTSGTVDMSISEVSMSIPDAHGEPSVHRLAAQVVHMARTWAAEQDAVGLVPEISTSVGMAQRNLMDAVHDLEYFEVAAPQRWYGLPPV